MKKILFIAFVILTMTIGGSAMAINLTDSYKTITWDLSGEVLHVDDFGKEGENGKGFKIYLLQGSAVVTPTTETLRMYFKKSDGNPVYIDATISGDYFLVKCTNEVYSAPGTVKAEMHLNVNGEWRISNTFEFSAYPNLVDGSVQSSNEFIALQDALAKVDVLEENYDPRLTSVEANKADKSYVDTLAASLASGGPKGVYATESELQTAFPSGNNNIYIVTNPLGDGNDYWYYWNGAAWTIGKAYQTTGYADKSIIPEYTSFQQIDLSSVIFTPQKYINMNTGVLADIASANYHATGFIPFNYAGLTFKIKTCTGTDSAGLAFYDENDVFISGLKTGNDTSVMTTTSFTVPDRTKKIRFSCIGASNISKVLIALNRTTDIVAAQAKLSEAIYNKIAIAWNTKTYVKSTGVIVAAPNDTFKSSSISVAKNERFKISGKSADAAVLYVLEDKDGNVVEVYPETVNNTYHQDVIINVKNDGVLKIGYYQTETALIKMPVIDADQDNNDYFYNESAYKTLLIRSVLFIGDSLTEGAYYHPDYNGLPISENYPYYCGLINQWEVTNAGKSGITTLNWWLTKKDAYNYADYDTFIIWLGTNEGLTDTLAADTASGNYLTYDDTNTGAYCKIIEHIKAANPKANIFLLNLYASSGDLTVSNNVLNQIASKYSLSLFAMNDGELSSSIYHPFSNTVHFGKHGNLAVAKKVSKYINQYISDNPAQFEETYLP